MVAIFLLFASPLLFSSSELIRNQTLKFLSKTLPVLKADDTLPKVTQIFQDQPVERYERSL